MSTIRFTYVGPPAFAGALAQELDAAGLNPQYRPPFETKDMGASLAIATVVFAATGNLSEIAACVHRFTSRFRGTRVDGLPEPERPVPERLAAVDQLLSDRVITPEEHAEQRSRILGEL